MRPTQTSKSNNPNGTFFGKKHTAEALVKQKSTFRAIGHAKGESNSQFGTCWVYSMELMTNAKIHLDKLSEYESQGWVRGRKMKFH